MKVERGLVIAGTAVNDGSDCFVIAEVGHNHQGSLEKAKELFRRAKECGVNAVKLQKRDNRSLYTREMYNMPYNHESSFGPTYGAHREALEFGHDEYVELKRYAREIGLTMFATPFDFASADFLAKLEMPAYKIASGDLKNKPLLKYVAEIGKPIFVSTGGGTMEDVQRAYDTIMPVNSQLCLLQCTASYPVEAEEMNLRVITTYAELFPDVVVGLSDHQNGIAMAVVAYAVGARVIEKHFTLNRAWKGTDHAFSLEPIGLRKYCRDLERTAAALGSPIKSPLEVERGPLVKMGKAIVAARELDEGQELTSGDVEAKSPAEGMAAWKGDRAVGKRGVRPYKRGEPLRSR